MMQIVLKRGLLSASFFHRLPQKPVRSRPNIEQRARNAQAVKINWDRPFQRGTSREPRPNVQQVSLIHHHFFAWGKRQWLRSRFTPRATSLRDPLAQQPYPQPHGHGSTVSSSRVTFFAQFECASPSSII